MGYQLIRTFSCDACEQSTGPQMHEEVEEDEDTEMPIGWVLVNVSRKIVNPARPRAIIARTAEVERIMAGQVNVVLKMAGGEITDDALPMVRSQALDQAEAQVEPVEEPEFIVEYTQGHFCHECATMLNRLDIEPFPSEDGDE